MSLPNGYEERKDIPVFDGVVMYFPDAIAEIAKVSKAGNDQHNKGEPIHWARGKSMDQFNTAMRHMIDHRTGGGWSASGTVENNNFILQRYDTDGVRHLAKAAWRILAALQLDIEAERASEVDAKAELPRDYGLGQYLQEYEYIQPGPMVAVTPSDPDEALNKLMRDLLEKSDEMTTLKTKTARTGFDIGDLVRVTNSDSPFFLDIGTVSSIALPWLNVDINGSREYVYHGSIEYVYHGVLFNISELEFLT